MSNDSSKPGLVRHDNAEQVVIRQSHSVTWGPLSSIVVSILAFVIGFLMAGTLVYFIARVFGHTSEETETWLSSVAGQFVFVLLAEGLIIAFLAWYLHFRRTSLRALGYRRRPMWTDAAMGVMGFVTYFVALLVATALARSLLHVDVDQKQELGFDTVVTLSEKLMAFVGLVILPPLVEETLFRGFLYTGLRKKLPFIWTTVFVSLVFATLHLFASSEGLLWIAGIDTFLLSLTLCYLREKTGNLWAPIIVHALKNGLAFLFLYIFTMTL